MIKYEAVCDRCHGKYEPFFPRKMEEKLYFNGFMLVTFDARHNYHIKKKVDLCKKCCEDLKIFLGGEIEKTNLTPEETAYVESDIKAVEDAANEEVV